MNNPDDYIEGTYNSMNPANWADNLPEFDSEDLSECLDYAKDHHDFEPLENAIFLQEIKVKKALELVDFCIGAIGRTDIGFVLNKLTEIKRILK